MKRLVAAVVPVALLAGCATVGQPGDPGVAASWHGTVVTNAEVSDWAEGSADLGLAVDSGAAVTFLLLTPELEKFAAENDISVTDADLTADATEWLTLRGEADVEVTPEMLGVLRAAWLLDSALLSEEFIDTLIDDMASIDEDAVVSPLYGDFTPELFGQRVSEMNQNVVNDQTGLGELAYIHYVGVSGFDTAAAAPWFAPTAEPAP